MSHTLQMQRHRVREDFEKWIQRNTAGGDQSGPDYEFQYFYHDFGPELEERAMGHGAGVGQEHYDTSGFGPYQMALLESKLRGRVTVHPVDTQDKFIVPGGDDTDTRGEIIDDFTTHNQQDIPTSQVWLQGFQLSSKQVPVHNSLILSNYGYSGLILRLLGQRISRGQEYYAINGNGTGEPNGLVNAAPSPLGGVSMGYQGMVDIEGSVNQSYRDNATWLMSPTTAKQVKNISDTAGRLLYLPGLPGSIPATFMGHVIVESVYCPDDVIFFGDMTFVNYRESTQIRIIQNTETLAEKNQSLFCLVTTFDTGLSSAGGSNPPVTQTAVA